MPYPLGYDNERRLHRLMDRQERGETLTEAEKVELETLQNAWNDYHDPLNNPPPDAGLLLWREDERSDAAW